MVSRRQFLSRAGRGAALVVGFDAIAGRWVSSAAKSPRSGVDGIPPLDGVLLSDPASRRADSVDLGNMIDRVPAAVLRPGSVDDIVTMVRFCRERDIHVAMRGQAHSTFGQGLSGGLVIESRWLGEIHSIDPTGAVVDAGVLWHRLIETAYEQRRLTPPVITGYTFLSVGGTLSVGGVTGFANHAGAQVDHVQELEVVTGAGELLTCSPSENAELFDVVRGGLGQCALITRARLDLAPAKPMARTYLIEYTDNTTFFGDLRTLTTRGELDGIYNLWLPSPTTLAYQINAVAFFDPASAPDDNHLLRGLSVPPSQPIKLDTSYLDFVFRVDRVFAAYQAAGWDKLVKPWFDVWLPDHTVEQYIGEVIPTLSGSDVGPTGFVLLFPQRRSALRAPFLRLPDTSSGADWVYLFDVLTSSSQPAPDPEFARRMLDRNRKLYDKASAAGGTRYPIGSLEFSREDWIAQYSDSWGRFRALKRRYDPDNILTPGPGIFATAKETVAGWNSAVADERPGSVDDAG